MNKEILESAEGIDYSDLLT